MKYLLPLLLLVGCPGEPDTDTDTDTEEPATPALGELARGFDQPVALAVRPGTDVVYVAEQGGTVRPIVDGGRGAVFLDVTGDLATQGWEQGLLGLAFPPDHDTTGHLYVNFTRAGGDTIVARFTASGDTASASTRSDVLVVDQPFGNHNGGHLAFGPDGMLYIGMGDGGSGGDPRGHGQNGLTLLGSMLRIDVSGATPYTIPSDNPFVGDETVADEAWAIGVRNPWRFSFDRSTGDLYIGDVGQDRAEEIDWQPADSGGGENYGWNIMEAGRCYAASDCDMTGLTMPVHTVPQGPACSITGGYVYRGTALTGLVGHYVYGDFCSNQVWSFRMEGGASVDHTEWTAVLDPAGTELGGISTFGEDAAGEILVASLNTGRIHQLIAAP